MICKLTVIKIADNSGAKEVRVFQILKGSFGRSASIGDIVVGSVILAEPFGNVKKGDVVKVVIVRVKKVVKRSDGTYVRFDDNAGVIINETGAPVGTRIFGPIGKELQAIEKFSKIVSMAKYVI